MTVALWRLSEYADDVGLVRLSNALYRLGLRRSVGPLRRYEVSIRWCSMRQDADPPDKMVG